ncbi:MAG: choice-of-anchor D domain-containing protein [Dokdonella sp.]
MKNQRSISIGVAFAMITSANVNALSVFDAAWPDQFLAATPRLVNVSPIAVDFGAIKVGASILGLVTVKNLTNQAKSVTIGAFNTAGGFTSSPGTCGGSNALLAYGSCSLYYTFKPTAPGQTFSANASISVGSTVQTLNFIGSGTESLGQVSPVAVDFGTSQIGATVVIPVTITNNLNTTITSVGGSPVAPPFGITGDTCGGNALGPGSACHLNYSFTPSTTASATGATGVGLSVLLPNISMYAPLNFSGDGSTSSSIATLVPRSIDFGSIKIGRTVTFDFVATNISAGIISFSGGGFNDNAGGAFAVSGSCGGGLAAGAQCSFSYRFQPRVLGAVSAVTSVGASGSGQGKNFPLSFSGTGIGTLAQVTPVDIDFGQVQTGTYMDVPVTVTNTSEAPLTGFLGGSVNYPFSAANGCPTSLDVGAACQIVYRFQPGASVLGLRSTTTILSFTNTTGVRPNNTITLKGTGYDPDKIFLGNFD